MLNMTIEQFKQQLDEMLEHYKQIIGKQRQIRLSAVNNTILCYEAEILLRFAKENKLPVKIEYDAEEDTFSYSYLIEYENVYLQAFSKEKEYQLYKKGGLVS